MKNISQFIDHTLLSPETTENNIIQLCKEASLHSFYSVCINPIWVEKASRLLKETNVKICTVIGFPLGANTTSTKANETKEAIKNGAHEIDMVLNIGKMKEKDYNFVLNDIKSVVQASNNDTVIKVIIETALLTKKEKIKACHIINESGAHFIKTSTGFSSSGATLEDIFLFRQHIDSHIKIKASGGIKDSKFANELINNGVSRLGTSSGVEIITNQKSNKKY